MRIDSEKKLGFKDVLIRPKRSTLASRAEVSLERRYVFRNSQFEWSGTPIMAANMDTVGTFSMAEAASEFGIITAVHKHYTPEDWSSFVAKHPAQILNFVAVSTGISTQDYQKLCETLRACPGLRFICIDVANGYSQRFVDFVRKVRHEYPAKVIVAGNVVTGEMVEELILSGADIVKIGIGPGSVCTTRVKTGVGYPQLSAIIECADAAHGLGGHVISDGGCTCPGDIAKAFGGGADFVMLGGMLAAHNESGGDIEVVDGKSFYRFYGMSSATAMQRHAGGMADYRAAEGKSTLIPHRGPVSESIKDILGGLRSCCTYVGAAELKQLSKRTTFIVVGEQENQVFS